MALWNLYIGNNTENFAKEIDRVNKDAKIFWAGKHPGTQGDTSTGLDHFSFDDANGTLRRVGPITGDLQSVHTLATHPTLPVLYASEFARPARLLAFRAGEDGTLEQRSATESFGELGYGITVHPNGRFAYGTHWGNGVLSSFRLDEDGSIVDAELVAKTSPRDGFESHHHDVRVTPSGNALLVADVGLNDITVYALDRDGAVITPAVARIDLPVGSQTRNIEFHPSGEFVYVDGEQDSMLHVFEAEDGVPRKVLKSYSTRPPGYDGKNTPSELRLHPDGRTLYVGNRGSNTVAIYSVDGAGGVDLLGHEPALGKSPRALMLDPTGRYLITGNRESSDVTVFEIDQDRTLHAVGAPVHAPSPCALAFIGVGDDNT